MASRIRSASELAGDRWMHDQHQVGIVDRRHRYEVAQQRIRLVRDQRLVDRLRIRHQQQRVAVRRALGHRVGAGDRAGARPVLDDERLAHRVLQPLREEARVDVGRAAGGERHDDLHGAGRIVLRTTRRCGKRQQREAMIVNDAARHGMGPPVAMLNVACAIYPNRAVCCNTAASTGQHAEGLRPRRAPQSTCHASRHHRPHRRQRRDVPAVLGHRRPAGAARAVAVRRRAGTRAWDSRRGSSSPTRSCTAASCTSSSTCSRCTCSAARSSWCSGSRRYLAYYLVCVVSAGADAAAGRVDDGRVLSDRRRVRRRVRPAARLRRSTSRTTA